MSNHFNPARTRVWKLWKRVSNAVRGRQTDRLREPYVRSLEEAYSRNWRGCPCYFVLSTGRVGTQTLSALLELDPSIHSEHEAFPRLIKSSFDAYIESTNSKELQMHWNDVVLAARDDLVFRALRQGKKYLETNNRLTYFAQNLAEVFPDSRFIHMHRHPYEVILSGMRRRYYEAHPWDFARIRPRPGTEYAERWSSITSLEKVAWYWAEVNRLAIDFMRSGYSERCLVLPAQSLFCGEQRILLSVFAFFDIPIPDRDDLNDVLGKQLNRQATGVYPRPKDWSSEDLRLVNGIVRTVADMLGYELE